MVVRGRKDGPLNQNTNTKLKKKYVRIFFLLKSLVHIFIMEIFIVV